jgi:outer membrane protein OmpA-like peptidoglycan-associated protein
MNTTKRIFLAPIHVLVATSLFVFAPLFLWSQTSPVLERLANDINTTADEINPILDWDGSTMYFTRVGHPDFNKTLLMENEDQSAVLDDTQFGVLLKDVYSRIAEQPISDPVHSSFNQDIWIAQGDLKGNFTKIMHPGAPVNNALPNSISTMTPEPHRFVVINQFIPEGGMDIGFSEIEHYGDTAWSFPKPIVIEDYYTRQSGTSLTMSSDGALMILALNRSDTRGDNDLYISFHNADGTWAVPKNLGKGINTEFRESTPHLSADMKILYFSSNRPKSLGGMDIFFVERLDDSWEKWSDVQQFVEPINSKSDDSQPYFNSATGYLYFTSRRLGNSDIFRLQIAPPLPETVTVTGKMLNSKTGEPIIGDILYGDTTSEYYQHIHTSRDGTFSIVVPKGMTYKFEAQKEGFIGEYLRVKFDRARYYNNYVVNLSLDPIEVNGKISLPPIFFQQSEATILPKSYNVLNHLVEILKDHRSLHILIEGHTDNAGTENSLLELSERRALAIKDFLVQKKINPDRLTTEGLGSRQLIFTNAVNETQRQRNRRVEVKITKVE